jgi:hypothetical protein
MIFRPLPSSGALCAASFLLFVGCTLVGVEPDELYNDGESGTGEEASADTGVDSQSGDGDGDNGGDGDGDPGDGDGDAGDGDGDAGDGDGDGDGGGDGDGDSAGDGDGDGGDGDGDGDPGDGDCEEPTPVVAGPNDVTILGGASLLEGSCGANGPESVYTYTATGDGLVDFEVTSSDVDLAMYLMNTCDPQDEIVCVADPDPVFTQQLMTQGQIYYIVLDSFAGGGNATLEITPN